MRYCCSLFASCLLRVEDGDSEYIYHSEQFMVTRQSKRKQSQEDQVRVLEVTIPVREPLPPQYFVRILSDSWVGCDSIVPVSFKHLILPTVKTPYPYHFPTYLADRMLL